MTPPPRNYRDGLKILARFSALLNSSLYLEDVLNNALACVEMLVNAEVCSIFEVDRETGELFFRQARGAGAEKISGMRLKIGEGIAGWVALTAQALIVPDVCQDSRFCRRFDQESGFTTRSILCVPIKAKEQLIGVLEVLNKQGGEGFTEDDLEILTILGNQIGTALENARLYSRLREKLALTMDELKLAQARIIQSERLLALAELAKGVAHEVRNPVTIIGGFVHRLQRLQGPDDPIQATLALVVTELHKLERMVREIEAFTRLPEARYRPTELAALMTEVIEALSHDLQVQGIGIECHFEPPLPVVAADGALLRLALQELINNAREAMPQGGLLVITLTPEPDMVLLTLKDTGTGIAPADLPNVFDPFFSSKPNGTGMGLTMVYRIVTEHRGEITLSSGIGEGTKVRLRLPRWEVQPEKLPSSGS
jgi:signal transduction histidine kinase